MKSIHRRHIALAFHEAGGGPITDHRLVAFNRLATAFGGLRTYVLVLSWFSERPGRTLGGLQRIFTDWLPLPQFGSPLAGHTPSGMPCRSPARQPLERQGAARTQASRFMTPARRAVRKLPPAPIALPVRCTPRSHHRATCSTPGACKLPTAAHHPPTAGRTYPPGPPTANPATDTALPSSSIVRTRVALPKFIVPRALIGDVPPGASATSLAKPGHAAFHQE